MKYSIIATTQVTTYLGTTIDHDLHLANFRDYNDALAFWVEYTKRLACVMGGRFFVPLIVADIGAPIGCALALSDIRNTIGQSCAPSDAPLASFESRQSVIGRVNRTQSRELSDGRANRLIALANYRIGQTESKNPNQRTDSDLC